MKDKALKDKLKKISKDKKISFQSLWKKLVLERFLARLSESNHHANFIFKGGLLLAYYVEIGRETKDLDFLSKLTDSKEEIIASSISNICNIPYDDGFTFNVDSLKKLSAAQTGYHGFRVTLSVSTEKMKDRLHIDIGVGDVVNPRTEKIKFIHDHDKPIFEDSVSLMVYPVETIFAEKFHAAIKLGSTNSRMKDYHDLYILSTSNIFSNKNELLVQIHQTFSNRKTKFLEKIEFDESEERQMQSLWSRHLTMVAENGIELPKNFSEIVSKINEFVS